MPPNRLSDSLLPTYNFGRHNVRTYGTLQLFKAQHAGRPTTEASARPQKRHKSAATSSPSSSPEPALPDQMEDDRVSDDNDYDYEYEDDEDFDDDNMALADDSGGGASAGGGSGGSGKGAGGAVSSAADAEVDLALRDESTVAFIDEAQLKVLMSKVVNDIR